MSFDGAKRALELTLKQLVARYQSLAGGFAIPVELSRFELSREVTETIFSAYDEDYHISRFFHFSDAGGTAYVIGGERATHVAIEAGVKDIL